MARYKGILCGACGKVIPWNKLTMGLKRNGDSKLTRVWTDELGHELKEDTIA